MKFELLHILSLITAVIEGLFFTGLIFGWSSISFVLKQEGYFSLYCSSGSLNTSTLTNTSSNITGTTSTANPTCTVQEESINLVFTIASVALSFSTLPNGAIFDHFGTWVARVFAILLFTCGCVLVSVSSIATSWMLYPAMCCLAVGGILMLLTNMQLGNLFGPARSSVITLLNGALDSSSFVFLLVKLAYDQGIHLSTIFQFIAICSIFQWARTILLLPKMHIPFPLPKGKFQYGLHDCKTNATNLDNDDPSKIQLQESGNDETETKKEPVTADSDTVTFISCVKCVKFWTNLMHLSILQLRNYFFLGTFVTWMDGLLSAGSNELGGYINVFGICQFFGVLTAPLNGFLIDGTKKWFSKSTSDPAIASAKAVSVSAFTTSLLGVLFSLIVAIPIAPIQYISFVLQVVFRSFLYGGNASFIAFSFPVQHFGKLYGLTMTLGGVVALLQFPLFSLVLRALNKDFTSVNIAYIIICALTSIHPALLYWSSVKKEKKLKSKPKSVEKENLTANC
uniref:Solute carrier family 43 member 3-like n=1 Tax=Phallusia mammillata TaxID=59560 RepID=A0A6F9DTT2_9ASCI|nr:solute carrier family 43 member 3-like [Phallusia mammillata]